ncbi:MAG: dihydroorotase [Desulfobacterales bacterium]|jgi:dihydroorotase
MDLLIRGGRVIDPGQCDGVADVYIRDGKIAGMTHGGGSEAVPEGCRVVDATGLVVAPGFIDLHVHLREPGHEYKETIASGCQAAAAGGFMGVCAMPNTDPVNDCAQVTEFILAQAEKAASAHVYPVAAVSPGSKGEGLTAFGELQQCGAVAFSDDGRPIANSLLMRRALEYARGFGMPVISHCEDLDLSDGGAMNEGEMATRLGLPGIPNTAESIMAMRDVALCELTGGRLHIAHVSTAETVAVIRQAKARGIRVTAETAPHYFTLTDEAVRDYDTNTKMYPPLRTRSDGEAIRQGLADGTLDAIACDHAPHSSIEKMVEFDRAANGIIGLETSLPLSLKLVHERVINMARLVELMATGPARLLGLEHGLQTGMAAHLTLIAPELAFTVDVASFASLSRNCPFHGWPLKGRAVMTIVDGRVVYELPAP